MPMEAPSKSSTASIPERTSGSACQSSRSPTRPGLRRMRHRLILLVAVAVAVAGCGSVPLKRSRDSQTLPTVDRNSTEATVIAAYLDTCLKLARGTPAEQAEIL